MKRIAFFQSDLGVGGIQKSLINLLKNIDYEQVEVDLYLSEPGGFWDVEFPEKLNLKQIPATNKLCKFMPFDFALKLAKINIVDCPNYDLAIDFNSYQFSCAAAALSVPAKKRVMWVHNDVEVKLKEEWKYRVLWHFFKGKFKYYDKFAFVSEALIIPFKRASKLKDIDANVIQNYIDISDIRNKVQYSDYEFSVDDTCVNFVALGRLCHQKGYDIMLKCFASACKEREDIRLYIIGGGDDESGLRSLAESLGISDMVFFLGSKTNPYYYMSKMDAFISTSRYEGQGMNIMEAMAIGLPLYCTKNLEQYCDGFSGKEDMVAAIVCAKKEDKTPSDLIEYNQRVLDSVIALAEG